MPDRIRPQSIRSRLLILSLVGIAGVAVSILIYGTLISREQSLVESQFQLHAQDVASAIERSFAAHLEVVGALTAFDHASEEVRRDEFHIFTSHYLPSRPGIRELAWLPQIRDEDRVRHTEETAREPGLADYQIRDLDAKGNVVTPAATREVYSPVHYLERTESAHPSGLTFGLDLATQRQCRIAMQQACNTGQLVTTRQIAPGDDNKGLNGYFAFVPIFNKELSEQRGTQERRDNLKGFVVGVCSIEAIVKDALRNSWPRDINVQLLDYPPDAGGGANPWSGHDPRDAPGVRGGTTLRSTCARRIAACRCA